MDVVRASASAVFHACRTLEGLKVILADDYMLDIVKMAVGWQLKRLLTMEVFLLDQLTSARETMPEVSCIVILQPNLANIELLEEELADPKYSYYSIFFAREPADDAFIKRLAAADTNKRIKDVEVLFMNYYPITPNLFSLSCPKAIAPRGDMRPSVRRTCIDGIVSLCKALKIKPRVRFQGSSPACEVLSNHVNTLCSERGYDRDSLALVIDRRIDIVTPVVVPWTYAAMCHDFFGIEKNRLDTSKMSTTFDEPNPPFSCGHDKFLLASRDAHFVDMKATVASLKQDIKTFNELRDQLQSTQDIAAMAKIVDQIPALREKSDIAAIHLKAIIEVNDFYSRNHIHDDNETSVLLEQLRVCAERKSTYLKRLKQILSDVVFRNSEKLRLLLLYCANHSAFAEGIKLLNDYGMGKFAYMVEGLEAYLSTLDAKATPYSPFKYSSQVTPFNEHEAEFPMFAHTPTLAHILSDIADGKLSPTDFPGCDTPSESVIPKKLVVFVIGGATFEEAKILTNFSKKTGIQAVLGGTMVHNFDSFVGDWC